MSERINYKKLYLESQKNLRSVRGQLGAANKKLRQLPTEVDFDGSIKVGNTIFGDIESLMSSYESATNKLINIERTNDLLKNRLTLIEEEAKELRITIKTILKYAKPA